MRIEKHAAAHPTTDAGRPVPRPDTADIDLKAEHIVAGVDHIVMERNAIMELDAEELNDEELGPVLRGLEEILRHLDRPDFRFSDGSVP